MIDPPAPGGPDADAAPTEGTFLVTHADEESAVLRNVASARVHTLGDNPGVAAGDVLEARLEPQGPMAVTWTIVDITDRRQVTVEHADLEPTARAHEVAAEQTVGEITRLERSDYGELHVITVPEEETDQAARDVVEDEATLVRAAGMEAVRRVEVRTATGVISVRYLP